MKNKILFFVLLGIFPVFNFSCVFITQKDVENLEYKGIITKIYNDEKNHNVITFVVSTNKGYLKEISNFFPYSWEYAEVGDSIIKTKGTVSITIKKKDKTNKIFYFDTN